MAHAEVLDKRVSQSEPGWEYLMMVPAQTKVAAVLALANPIALLRKPTFLQSP